MDMKVVGPIVLVLIIVGTMIAPWVSNALKVDTSEPTPFPDVFSTPVDTTQYTFYAEMVDGNIFELADSYPLLGYTDETNIIVVQERILALGSIMRLDKPAFRDPDSSREKFMPFFAEVIPLKDRNMAAIVLELEASGILEDIEYGRTGFVKIPTVLHVRAYPDDLNIERDVNFAQPFVFAQFDADALIGDRLQLDVVFNMVGDELLKESVQAQSRVNISASPEKHTSTFETKISKLEETLGFDESVSFTGFKESEMETALLEVTGIEGIDFNMELQDSFFGLLAAPEAEDINSLKQDLNAALSSLENVSSIFFFPDDSSINMRAGFVEGSYAELRPVVIEAIDSVLGETDYNFEDPTARLTALIEFSGDANIIAFTAATKMNEFDALVPIWQDAFFRAESLKDDETGEEFALVTEDAEQKIRVRPGSTEGQSILVEVIFPTIRKEIIWSDGFSRLLGYPDEMSVGEVGESEDSNSVL